MPESQRQRHADAQAHKRAYRAEVRERRRQHTLTQRAAWSESLTERMIALCTELGARRVSCYASLPDEPDTSGFIDWARRHDVEVLLPVSRDDGLLDWALATDDEPTVPGMFGIDEPSGEPLSPMAVNDVDLMLVPASGVDANGVRTGWGRGYFDKTLGSMAEGPPVFAVIFDDELVDELPREAHDEPVDGVVTPSRTVRFARD